MKFFGNDDSGFKVITQAITIIGVGFGVYAYFHTIHPIFEKTHELNTLKDERTQIKTQIDSLRSVAQIASDSGALLIESVHQFRNVIDSIVGDNATLNQRLNEAQKALNITLSTQTNAGHAAIVAKLELWSHELFNDFLRSINPYSSPFSFIEESDKMIKKLDDEVNRTNDPYDNLALDFFRSRIEELPNIKSNDEQWKFIIGIPSDYRISNNVF